MVAQKNACIGQVSLFDSIRYDREAVSCFTGIAEKLEDLKDWMKNLVPDGIFYVMIGSHPLVLRKTKLTRAKVPAGHEFYHYMVDGDVHSGIFVGGEG